MSIIGENMDKRLNLVGPACVYVFGGKLTYFRGQCRRRWYSESCWRCIQRQQAFHRHNLRLVTSHTAGMILTHLECHPYNTPTA